MADPHIHIFGDKAYLYSTRDKSPHSTDFEMPGWDVWRSSDLVHWDHLTAISPQQTYIGKQAANATRRRTGGEFVRFAYSGVLACFAADVIARNGVYAFFFSNGDTNMGVMTASSPSLSDAVDAIGRPLVSTEALPTVPPGVTVTDRTHGAYDPTLLLDEDGVAYVCFGLQRPADHGAGKPSSYLLARLSTSLTELAETPRPVEFLPHPHTGKLFPGADKSTLHKRQGTYYLSSGAHYATSKSVYGPYTYRGDTVGRHPSQSFGLTGQAHGRFFEWRGQWFHVYCLFVENNAAEKVSSRKSFFRESWITYTHYGRDGEMVDDWKFLALHGKTGVGRYDASWPKIEAEWYTGATACEKVQADAHHSGVLPPSSFAVRLLGASSSLLFSNVENLPHSATLTLAMRGIASGGTIRVHRLLTLLLTLIQP